MPSWVMIPAAIGLRGNIFGALGNRLSTSIHAGTFRLSARRESVLVQNVLASLSLTFVLSLLLAVIAKVVAIGFDVPETIPVLDLALVSVLGGLIASVFVLGATIALSIGAVRREWDLDNLVAPTVSTLGDVVTIPALFLATFALGHGSVTAVLGWATVALSVATVVTSLRAKLVIFGQILRESMPVLVVALGTEAEGGSLLAAAVFVVAAATDGLDGYIARSRQSITNFGKVMDPVADKLLIAAALLTLVSLDRVDAWVAMIVIAREFAVSGLRIAAGQQGVVIPASGLGKVKTMVQSAAVLALIAVPDPGVLWVQLLVYAMVLTTIVSGADYFLNFRRRIEELADAPARHPSVQHVQSIFRENAHRLWHWAEDPRVPAENNAAERAVRPLAIARKVSHGSQSARGRETRSALMSVLHTLANCCTDPARRLAEALDRYAEDRNTDMFARVFGGLPLYIPTQ